MRTAGLGDAFKTYEDRIAFGLVAAGHHQEETCAEAELIAKPGEFRRRLRTSFCSGGASKPKLGRPIAAALVEAAKQTPSRPRLCSLPTASTAARPMSAPR